MRLGVAFHELQEAVITCPRDVGERPQRSRREQRIAATPQHASERSHLVAETAKDECLADPRLAWDEDDATSTVARFGEGNVEAIEHRLALEEIAATPCCRYAHRRIVAADEAPFKWRRQDRWRALST